MFSNPLPNITGLFIIFKHSLVIILAMLQLVSPLVHAHANEKKPVFFESSSGKLHIPGLENYNLPHKALTFDSIDHRYSAEGITFGVDAGIKLKQAKLIVDPDNNYFIIGQPLISRHSIASFYTNFYPQLPRNNRRLLDSSHSPRAPPPAQ